MTNIKELALRVAKETLELEDSFESGSKYAVGDNELTDFAQRFLAAYLAEQEPVASVINTDNLYDIRWLDKIDVLLPHGAKLFTAPPLPEPAPQEADNTAERSVVGSTAPACAAPTKAQALEALDSMDDFARIADIDAIGPRKVLKDYINGAAVSSKEVLEMVDRMNGTPADRIIYGPAAADLIERLAFGEKK